MEFYMNEQRELVREMVREFVEKNGNAEAYTTRAVLDGDEWVINGSKCFVTLIVPFKYVKASEDLRIGADGLLDTSLAQWEVSEYDLNAVEAAPAKTSGGR